MISAELIRRYPFFACLTDDQILKLARIGEELTVEAGHYFFYERDRLKNLYILLKGNVDITIGIPERNVK